MSVSVFSDDSDQEIDQGVAKQEIDDLDSEDNLPKKAQIDEDLDDQDQAKGSSYNPLGGSSKYDALENDDDNDALSQISDMDVDDSQNNHKQKAEQYTSQKNEYDSELSDYDAPVRDRYQDQEIVSKKIRKKNRDKDGSKKKKRRVEETFDNQAPKLTGKDARTDKLQEKSDQLCAELITQMQTAEKKDAKYQKAGRPAFQKLLMLNKLQQKLNNSVAKTTFIEEKGLDLLAIWIQNCGQNISFRKKILILIKQLSTVFTQDNLINSYLVSHCQSMKGSIQNKEKVANDFDRETKNLYINLVDSWGPILGDRK